MNKEVILKLRNINRTRILFVVLVILIAFSYLISSSFFSFGQKIIAGDYLEVDFLKSSYNQKSMTGFLHQYKEGEFDNIVNDLKPRYWRIGGNWIKNPEKRMDVINSLNKKGIKPIFILSSAYSYKHMAGRGWVDPVNNSSNFLSLVEKQYRELGNKVIYDVWNEPNHKAFWQQSDESFFKLFKLVHDRIRSLPGGQQAIITGPSTTGFYSNNNRGLILRFLDFCNKNKVRVDILNWHDMRAVYDYNGMQKFKNDIITIKNEIKKYPNVGVKSIILPEIIGNKQQYSPLSIILINKVLEESGVDGTCKACWSNSIKQNNCFNNSLDGLFTANGGKRSVWWAYNLYAKSLTNRYNCYTNSKKLASFVSYNKSEGSIQILLANTAIIGDIKPKLLLKNINNLSSISKNGDVEVTLFEIPDLGEEELSSPLQIYKETVNVDKLSNYEVNKNLTKKAIYYIEINFLDTGNGIVQKKNKTTSAKIDTVDSYVSSDSINSSGLLNNLSDEKTIAQNGNGRIEGNEFKEKKRLSFNSRPYFWGLGISAIIFIIWGVVKKFK